MDQTHPTARTPAATPIGDARPAQDLFPLVASTAMAEIACHAGYVVLLERAYTLGDGPTSVGVVLFIQSVAQILLGPGAGSLTDRRGAKPVMVLAALLAAALLFALAFVHSLLLLYLIALLLMLARLVLIPARLGVAHTLGGKSRLMTLNSVLFVLAGIGGFLGPAASATIQFFTNDASLPLFAAALLWLASTVPMAAIDTKSAARVAWQRTTLSEELRAGWRLIGRRSATRHLLACLFAVSLVLGAATPLFTPLSRQLGLGDEGTGVLFAALGIGNLLGPMMATVLFRRMRLARSMLFMGLLAPAGLAAAALVPDLASTLLAIAVVALASGGLNVITVTVIQRLSPPRLQGTALGAEQTLLGLAWTVSLAAITAVMTIQEPMRDARTALLLLGILGALSLLGCWLWNQRSIAAAGDQCPSDLRPSSLVCWAIRGTSLEGCSSLCGTVCHFMRPPRAASEADD